MFCAHLEQHHDHNHNCCTFSECFCNRILVAKFLHNLTSKYIPDYNFKLKSKITFTYFWSVCEIPCNFSKWFTKLHIFFPWENSRRAYRKMQLNVLIGIFVGACVGSRERNERWTLKYKTFGWSNSSKLSWFEHTCNWQNVHRRHREMPQHERHIKMRMMFFFFVIAKECISGFTTYLVV